MAAMDLVTFEIGGESYAMGVAAVREVVVTSALLPAGDATPFLTGWAELRGEAVPVVDLCARLGLGQTATGPLLIVWDTEDRPLGLRVDAVRSVGRGVERPVAPVPSFFAAAGELLKGLIEEDSRLMVMIDVAALLSVEETELLSRRGPPEVA